MKEVHIGPITELATALCASLVFATGLALAYAFYYRRHAEQPARSAVAEFLLHGWGFDSLYNTVFVIPYTRLAEINRNDAVDGIYRGMAALTEACHRALRATETGHVRWYASGLAIGSALFLAVVLLSR